MHDRGDVDEVVMSLPGGGPYVFKSRHGLLVLGRMARRALTCEKPSCLRILPIVRSWRTNLPAARRRHRLRRSNCQALIITEGKQQPTSANAVDRAHYLHFSLHLGIGA